MAVKSFETIDFYHKHKAKMFDKGSSDASNHEVSDLNNESEGPNRYIT
jgi:hypothetical protein